MKFSTNSAEETQSLGEAIGSCLKAGDLLLLFGEMGAGKTRMTQGISNGLGLEVGEYVRSPSFTLVNEYQGKFPIYHIDLYRLESAEEIENLGLEEYFYSNGVAIVEWSEKLFTENRQPNTELLLEPRLEIVLKIKGEHQRTIDLDTTHFKDTHHPIFTLQDPSSMASS